MKGSCGYQSNKVCILGGVLLLASCDVTSQSAPSTSDSVSSPFVVVQAEPEQTSVPAATGGSESSSTGNTTNATDSEPTAMESGNNTGVEETDNTDSNETSGGTATSTAVESEAPMTTAETQSSENRLYQFLRSSGSSSTPDSFWACSTLQQDATFRLRFSGGERDTSYDVTSIPWGAASVNIDSISNNYDIVAPSIFHWKVESGDSVVISSTRSDFSASNIRYSSITFDEAGTRFSATDSNGKGVACARVIESSDPVCSYVSPYGGCVLSPIGVGNDAIEVVREFAPTTRLFNGTRKWSADDFWQCESNEASTTFRFFMSTNYFTLVNTTDEREPSSGEGWRYEDDGSLLTDSSQTWQTDALGAVTFSEAGVSRTGRPLSTSSWTMYDIHANADGQSFSASDSRGYDFSCERLVEYELGFSTCFHSPDTCPVD